MKIISTFLGIALLAVGGVAFHFWTEVGAARHQIADLTLRSSQQNPQPVGSTVTHSAAQAAVTDPASASDPARDSGMQSPPEAIRPALPAIATTMIAQMASPEAKARLRNTTRALMDSAYPDIGEAIGLSATESEKLLNLLVSHQENSNTVFNRVADGTINRQDRAAELQKVQDANDAELQAMLGSRYSKYKDYRETVSVWQQRRDLRAVLDASGTPLSEAQGRALIIALSAEQRRINDQTRYASAQGTPSADTRARYSPDKRQRLLDSAAVHLSPQQLEAYKGMLERAAAQEQAMLAPMRMVPRESAASAAR